eukprot:3462290-Rhodomonas_salina.1
MAKHVAKLGPAAVQELASSMHRRMRGESWEQSPRRKEGGEGETGRRQRLQEVGRRMREKDGGRGKAHLLEIYILFPKHTPLCANPQPNPNHSPTIGLALARRRDPNPNLATPTLT